MEAGCRVYGFSINSYFKMQVWPGRGAGRADGADGLSPLDALAVRDVDRREVPVARRIAAAVIDQDVVSVAPVPLRHDNGSAGRRRYGRAGRRRDVEALVELRRAAERVRAPAERRGDGSGDRP